MSTSAEFVNYVKELLEPLGQWQCGSFFGGVSFKWLDRQFAVVKGNNLYFVVNEESRRHYQALGMQPLSSTTKLSRMNSDKYYAVPSDVIEDPTSLLIWARQAIDAAMLLR